MKDTKESVALAEMPKRSVLASLSDKLKLDLDAAKLSALLKRTAFATCKTDDEFMAMCITANTYGLNPILKEIYAFPSKSGAVVPIVGIDGWYKIANSHPAFDSAEFDEPEDGSRCTCIIYRKDRSHPTKVTEWMGECKGTTEPWKRWPRRMLRHKAFIQCARLAFGFSFIRDEDEAERMNVAVEAEAENPKRGRRATAGELLLEEGADPALSAAVAPADAEKETAQAEEGDFLK